MRFALTFWTRQIGFEYLHRGRRAQGVTGVFGCICGDCLGGYCRFRRGLHLKCTFQLNNFCYNFVDFRKITFDITTRSCLGLISKYNIFGSFNKYILITQNKYFIHILV